MNEQPQEPDPGAASSSLWDDPVVEEVRAIRRKLWDDAGRNIHRFIEQTKQADERRRANKPKGGGA